jgi:hypothetical protein
MPPPYWRVMHMDNENAKIEHRLLLLGSIEFQ